MALNSTAPSLTTFSVLSFDIFGTLIDCDAGTYKALEPLLSQLPLTHPATKSPRPAIEALHRLEVALHEEFPSLLESKVNERIYEALASEWAVDARKGEAEAFANSMGDWQPFPDTIAAMQNLSKHYKLVALSNVDKATFARTLCGPLAGVEFDLVCVAEDIGSYKPDHRNFEYMLKKVETELGAGKQDVLMVAHGLGSDHVPTKEMGIESAWIVRGSSKEDEKKYKGKVGYQWRWESLGDMAKDAAIDLDKA